MDNLQHHIEALARPSVREARPTDAPALAALETAVFDYHQIRARSFQRLIQSPSASVLLVEQGDVCAGHAVILFRRGANVARLYSLAVRNELRGRGLGHLLLEECVRRAKERGVSVLSLEVQAEDLRLRRLYEKFGFTSTEQLMSYYDNGASAIRMVMSLRPPESRAQSSARS